MWIGDRSVNRIGVSAGIATFFFPVAAAPAVPAAAPAPAPIRAPFPPPAIAPRMVPSPAPPPMRAPFRFLCELLTCWYEVVATLYLRPFRRNESILTLR